MNTTSVKEQAAATLAQLNIKPKNDRYLLQSIGVWVILIFAVVAYLWVASQPDISVHALLILFLAPLIAHQLVKGNLTAFLSFLLKDDNQIVMEYAVKYKRGEGVTRQAIVQNIIKLDNGVKVEYQLNDSLEHKILLNDDYNGSVLQLLYDFFQHKQAFDLPSEAEQLQLDDTYRFTDEEATDNGSAIKLVCFVHQKPKVPLTMLGFVCYFVCLLLLIFA